MKKINYVNRHAFDHTADYVFSVQDPISHTEPDQALSLQDLLERHTRGQSVVRLTPEFFGEDDFPDFDRMDKVDREEYARQLRISVHQLQMKLSQEKWRKENGEPLDTPTPMEEVVDVPDEVKEPTPKKK